MYEDFQRKAEAFEFVFCRFETPSSITVDGGTERVNAELVSGNYFQALGVGPAVGRVFSPEADDRVNKGHPSVVLVRAYCRFGLVALLSSIVPAWRASAINPVTALRYE